MPLLDIVVSKKVTAVVTLEDATVKQIDQYAAMTKGSADDVIEAALTYVFQKDPEFKKYREENPTAKPTISLRIKRSTGAAGKPEQTPGSTRTGTAGAR